MLNLQTLAPFADKVLQMKKVDFNPDGTWKVQSIFERIWTFITFGEKRRLDRVLRGYEAFLDQLEGQEIKAKEIYDLSQSIFAAIDRTSDLRLSALYIRAFGTEEISPINLANDAQAWENAQECLDERTLSENDLNRLQTVNKFSSFIPLLKNPQIKHDFFEWTLRYKLPAEIFICFPGLKKKLQESFLHDTLASDEGALLQIDLKNWDVRLEFENNQIASLLRSEGVVRLGKSLFTVSQVFESFKNDQREPGELRYFPKLKYPDSRHPQKGICYWPKNKVMQLVNLNQEQFWHALPPVRRKDPKEAADFFEVPCDGKKWIIGLAATRSSKKIDFSGSHSYLIIAVPMPDGIYSLFPLSFFPTTYWNIPDSPGEIRDGEILYPDNNIDHHMRAHVVWAESCPAIDGETLFYQIRDDWLKSYHGSNELIFNMGPKNCCHWTSKKFCKAFPKSPDFFSINFFDTEPGGLQGKAFKWLKEHPSFQIPSLKILAYLKGGTRVKVITKKGGVIKKYTLMGLAPWNKPSGFTSPAKLFDLVQQRKENKG